ncbi:MAG: tetratricopeptide repeat protein [Deltaproteobacteria bacterium]|uniref:Tetratricopeptide repeat protein n=1 Tax=Candidatus Zymogenus saltonus TaxID=2844893 RepID=A0A9D8PMK2_9DELT|nr:tetratricopeptide repeat protein [Candidatus Zymogenus saltonus]
MFFRNVLLKSVFLKKFLVLIVLLFIAALFPLGTALSEEGGKSIWDKAQEMMDDGKYAEAVSLYSLAIEGNPTNPDIYDAYFSRGVALSYLKKYDSALEDYTKAIELKPDFKEAYLERGLLQLALKKLDEAIADLDMVTKLDSKSYVAYANRAIARFIKGDGVKALSDIEKSIEINPNCAGCHYSHYKILWSLGRDKEAEEAFKKAHSLDPTYERLGGN